MLSGLEARHAAQQKQQLKAAAYRAAATCYATEGFYPQDVQYLKKHYGLKWNEDRYILRYDCFASNILPVIPQRSAARSRVLPSRVDLPTWQEV